MLTALLRFGLTADAETPSKSEFNLFNPTPRELLRDLSPDRPDKTESPHTVDAGHFQIEMDLVGYTRDQERDRGTDATLDSFSVVPMNLKVGLLNDVDFQLIIEPFIHELQFDAGINIGVTDSADDLNPFVGMTFRY